MKNMLYIVIGKKWNNKKELWEQEDQAYVPFKNKEKANNYKETLLDKYMKMKSYSPKYTIEGDYIDEEGPIPMQVSEITDKNGDLVYCVEILMIDLGKVIM